MFRITFFTNGTRIPAKDGECWMDDTTSEPMSDVVPSVDAQEEKTAVPIWVLTRQPQSPFRESSTPLSSGAVRMFGEFHLINGLHFIQKDLAVRGGRPLVEKSEGLC